MSTMNLQHIVSAMVRHFPPTRALEAFSTVTLTDLGGFAVHMHVTAEQAEAIAAAFAPKVNAAGIPVFEGRAAAMISDTEKLNYGGPAFPQNDLSSYGMGPAEFNNVGMTLRDWFAGQAASGAVAAFGDANISEVGMRAIVREAYGIADAMLAAREAAKC